MHLHAAYPTVAVAVVRSCLCTQQNNNRHSHLGGEHSDEEDDDQDCCRICRGSAPPLYYPCKCSGSIKYVHQQCLMEWLGHSGNTHCEVRSTKEEELIDAG